MTNAKLEWISRNIDAIVVSVHIEAYTTYRTCAQVQPLLPSSEREWLSIDLLHATELESNGGYNSTDSTS